MIRSPTRAGRALASAILLLAPEIADARVNYPPPMFPSAVSGNAATAGFPQPPLIGPCDILAAAGTPCAAAHSVTRALFGGYTGPLFQLARASDSATENVGITASGLYNAATVATFCGGTACYITDIYDQTGNANHLPQATVANAAPWLLHPANGLPFISTAQNAAFYRNRPGNGGATQNLPTGSAAATTYYVRATDIIGGCCGDYGRMENSTGSISAGEVWALSYDNSATFSSGVLGLGTDFEGSVPTTALGTIPAVAGLLSKFNPATGWYTNKVWDAAKGAVQTLVTAAPPTVPPAVQAGLSLGEGGDGSTAPSEFFEGAVISGTTSAATDQAVAANIASFYGAAAASMNLGPVDLIANSQICGGAGCANHTKRDLLGSVGGAYGLRKLRFSYTGYAANIRRASDNHQQDIGFTSEGDFDNAAALTFCTGTTCFVAKLYNQSLSPLGNDSLGANYDLVQATTAAQPQLIFADLNNRTAMRTSSAQYLCSPTSGNTVSNLGPSTFYVFVGERTGSTGAVTDALVTNGFNGAGIKYPASGNTVEIDPAGGGIILTGTANDNTWHSIIAQINAAGSNGDTQLTIDGDAPATNAGNAGYLFAGTFNNLASGSFGTNCGTASHIFVGDWAEAIIGAIGGSGNQWTGHLSAAQVTAIYNNQHAYYGGKF